MNRRTNQRSARYEIVNADGLAVKFAQPNANSSAPISAALTQISLGGARFTASHAFPLSDAIQISIALQHVNVECEISARVVWARPLEGDE